MSRHLKHLAMCAPMIVLGAILVFAGVGFAALIPVALCVLMMGAMMAAMGSHSS